MTHGIDADAGNAAIPVGKQRNLAQIGFQIVWCERTGRAAVQLNQCIDRAGIYRFLGIPVHIKPVAHAVDAEILDQDQASLGAFGIDMRGAQAVIGEPFAHLQKRARVFLGRRRVHQHGAAAGGIGRGGFVDAEIAAEAGVAGNRLDPRPPPSGLAEEIVQPFRQSISHGIRFCQSGPPSTIALRP